MVDLNLLREIGLTNWESKAYIALLELGSTTTGPLVKKCEVPQSKIYEVLENLQSKGLCSWIVKGKTKYFQASEPQKILAILKDKEKRIQEIIPELEEKRNSANEKKTVEIFEGIKSIRAMLLGLLVDIKKNESFYGFATGESTSNPEVDEFYEWWGPLKSNVGLKDHLLISLEHKKEFERTLSEEDKKNLKNILKYSKVSFPGDTAIFRDKVVLLNWEGTPTATLISSKNIAKQYSDFFIGIWNGIKE